MSLVTEFKEFIARGNVIDLAVGVVIGGAFGKIVTSLVQDVVMPPINLITDRVPFQDLYLPLNESAAQAADIAAARPFGIIAYGAFLNTVLQFLIVAACIFMIVRVINRIKREEEAKPKPPTTAPPDEIVLLTEIRDALKK
ncbi:MAG: large-conductance mechanosensitive channel protein MscL [Chthoniobacterales bacterium]